MRRAAAILGAAALLGLAACGGEPSAEEQLCSDLDDLSEAVTSLQGFDLSSGSADELQTEVGDVTAALGEVVSAAQDVAQADVGELQSAVQAVTTAVGQIPSDGVEPVQSALDDLQQTRTSIADGVGCDDGS
jgi:hypothetical protein